MKLLFLILTVCTIFAACGSPTKQHNKEMQHKANKLQNVTSGPLAPKQGAGTQMPDTTATAKK